MSHKSFFIVTLSAFMAVLIAFAAVTVAVDPFFHYHAPLEELAYPIDSQRYQNDGILRNFDYDSVIIGTSMTENFKTSQWDELFDANTVKASLSGAYLKETADRLDTAFASNENIKYVIRSLDYSGLIADKDTVSDFDYPTHLYDDQWMNDVKYVLNKSVFFNETMAVFSYTDSGEKTTSFDDAYNWSDKYKYGKKRVLKKYKRSEVSTEEQPTFDELKQTVTDNMEQNVIRLAKEHPDTEFYYFFPPYSIAVWDGWNQRGTLLRDIEVMRYVAKMLMEYDNVHVYSFNDDVDTICNLSHYKDAYHYGEWINDQLFVKMKNEEGRLNADNVDAHFDWMIDFYTQYDYDAVFG